MSRRRGRRRHRRSRARPVASPPAFVKTVDHAFDPQVGLQRISLFISAVIPSLFLQAMTTLTPTPDMYSDVNNPDTATETDDMAQENDTDPSLYPSSEVVMVVENNP
uniref:Uncharacterized protein n=1 Tax=Branchiostoma floridae TaxID=7739 RepID=C3YLQ6_BRAFL|eukprot:XP_002602813.1 hypothetical protein BRAFLDRAFT_108681 [Branchiostoma floridae]